MGGGQWFLVLYDHELDVSGFPPIWVKFVCMHVTSAAADGDPQTFIRAEIGRHEKPYQIFSCFSELAAMAQANYAFAIRSRSYHVLDTSMLTRDCGKATLFPVMLPSLGKTSS